MPSAGEVVRAEDVSQASTVTPQIVNLPTGTSSHYYDRMRDLIVGEFHFVASGAGTGTFELTLPVPALGPVGTKLIGTVLLGDTGTTQYFGFVLLNTTTTARFVTTAQVTTTFPFTWASGDTVGGTYSYRAAP